MMRSLLGLAAIATVLAGCSANRPAAETEEVVIGDCLDGALLNQATFGGPVRCGPQSEPIIPEAPDVPQTN